MSELEYTDKAEKLSKLLRPVSDEQEANAAVALLLKLRNEEFHVLLVKRAENSADPWSGQIAFPGGKRDARDMSLKQTVIRETLEETNIDLHNRCRFLGVLTAIRSRPRPGLKILPFVVLLERGQEIELNEKELSDSFWIPLKDIVRGKGKIRLNTGKVPAYVVGPIIIWGLTYRILGDFVKILSLI